MTLPLASAVIAPPPTYKTGRLAFAIEATALRICLLCPFNTGLYERIVTSVGNSYGWLSATFTISLGKSTTTGPGRPVLAI